MRDVEGGREEQVDGFLKLTILQWPLGSAARRSAPVRHLPLTRARSFSILERHPPGPVPGHPVVSPPEVRGEHREPWPVHLAAVMNVVLVQCTLPLTIVTSNGPEFISASPNHRSRGEAASRFSLTQGNPSRTPASGGSTAGCILSAPDPNGFHPLRLGRRFPLGNRTTRCGPTAHWKARHAASRPNCSRPARYARKASGPDQPSGRPAFGRGGHLREGGPCQASRLQVHPPPSTTTSTALPLGSVTPRVCIRTGDRRSTSAAHCWGRPEGVIGPGRGPGGAPGKRRRCGCRSPRVRPPAGVISPRPWRPPASRKAPGRPPGSGSGTAPGCQGRGASVARRC